MVRVVKENKVENNRISRASAVVPDRSSILYRRLERVSRQRSSTRTLHLHGYLKCILKPARHSRIRDCKQSTWGANPYQPKTPVFAPLNTGYNAT